MMTTDSARLIKARSQRSAATAAAFNFEDLRRQCDDYLAESQQSAENILSQATAEAEEIRRQAYTDGFQAGQAAGLTAAELSIEARATEIAKLQTDVRVQTALPALAESIRTLQLERDRWLAHWEETAVNLSAAIAQKIVRAELTRNPQISQVMIREALELATGSSTLRVRLNPHDFAVLQEHGHDEIRRLTHHAEIEFNQDATIAPGGCIVETRYGVIDAQIETLIVRISNELLDAE